MRRLALTLLACLFAAAALPAGAGAAPMIVIKIDDLRAAGGGKVSAQWQRVLDFAKERKVKVNIGIICDSLEGNKPEYYQWIKDAQATGLVEFWLHGWSHKAWTDAAGVAHNEFAGRPGQEQFEILDKSVKLMREKTGITMHTFGQTGTGAPGPGIDDGTFEAMAKQPDMKVWLYAAPMDAKCKAIMAANKVVVLDRVWPVNIEMPLFVPSAEKFQQGYDKYAANREYFVLQGHPQSWKPEGFEQFVKLVDYAAAQGCEFVTASECAAKVGSNQKTLAALPAVGTAAPAKP